MVCNTAIAQPFSPSEGLEDARSGIISYTKNHFALSGIRDSSAYYVNMNGEWRAKEFNSIDEIPQRDLDKDRVLSEFGKSVTLPTEWKSNSKESYPFLDGEPTPGEFPIVSDSKCKLYIKDFTVPFLYVDKKLYFNIGAASSKVTLYINGEMVGYSTDSKNPAEFEISAYCNRGLNRAAIVVEEYSGGSWLEDGNHFNGITRDIYILAQPKIRVRDLIATTSLDPTYTTGLLETALLLKTELLNPHTVTVYYELYDPSGKVIRKENKDINLGMRKEDTVRFHSTLQDVEKWNNETPNLYTIIYSVKREGRYTEYASAKIGFREVKINGDKLYINGIAPEIRGVNYSENKSREDIKNDLIQLRESGVNALRTDGYPLPQHFYTLCDSIGMYVVSVSNISTKGLANLPRKGYSLSNDPKWCSIFKDRVISTYERTKYNPSVVAIALGEDAGNGYNMYESYMELKRRNPNLVVWYDGADAEWNTDVICPLYPTVQDINKLQKRGVIQPIILSKVKSLNDWKDNESVQGAFAEKWNNEKIAQLCKVEIANKKERIIKFTNSMQFTNLNQLDIRYRTYTLLGAGKWKTLKVDCPVGETAEVTLPSFFMQNKLEIEIGNTFKTTFEL